MNRFREFANIVSRNSTRTCWVLKCDIKKFFASIDQKILLQILARHIKDEDTLWLLSEVVSSFRSDYGVGVGLPLGNLTSQLLINVYMNEFDQFVMRELKAKYYIRYADDFVVLSANRLELEKLLPEISEFLANILKLELNYKKVEIRTLASGIDFLGWIHFSDHRILRRATRERMLRKIVGKKNNQSYQSYLGIISHGYSFKIKNKLDDLYFG